MRLPTPHGGLGGGFARVWTASAISNLGDGAALVAAPLLAASLTRDPSSVAAVVVAAQLPWLVVSLHAGALVDRVDRRAAMVAADLVRAAALALLGVAALAGWASLPLIAVVAFVATAGDVVFSNAAHALLPALVPRQRLQGANARLTGAEVVTNGFVGQPLAGVLFVVAAGLPFLLDAASFVASALILLGLRRPAAPAPAPERRPRLRSDIAEGLRWLWRDAPMRTVTAILAVTNLVSGMQLAVLVLFALEVLGLGAGSYGLLLAAAAGGSLVGSVVAPWLARRAGVWPTLLGAILLEGLALLALGLGSSRPLAGAMLGVGGLVGVVWHVTAVSLRQASVPDRLLGRVTSAQRLVGAGTVPVGALVGGLLSAAIGLRAPFVLGGAALVLTGGVGVGVALAARRSVGGALDRVIRPSIGGESALTDP
jgi:transmembrane secretion effector